MEDPRKHWKLSPTDLESQRLWYEYSRARDEMFSRTHTGIAPWYIVPSDDKLRINVDGEQLVMNCRLSLNRFLEAR